MKLIDMEKVLSELCLSHKDIIYIDKNETAESIRKIPSIDIVRCKECKYFIDNLTENDTDETYDACRWDWKKCIPKADDFCSYGTRSKMEQVDKDINVRSKDEPQLTPNYCGTCKHREVPCGDLPCDVCHGYSNYEPKDEPQTCDDCIWNVCNYNKAFKDEPQTDTEIAKAIVHKMIDDAVIAEDAYPDLRQKMHDAVDEYEPQTERSE